MGGGGHEERLPRAAVVAAAAAAAGYFRSSLPPLPAKVVRSPYAVSITLKQAFSPHAPKTSRALSRPVTVPSQKRVLPEHDLRKVSSLRASTAMSPTRDAGERRGAAAATTAGGVCFSPGPRTRRPLRDQEAELEKRQREKAARLARKKARDDARRAEQLRRERAARERARREAEGERPGSGVCGAYISLLARLTEVCLGKAEDVPGTIRIGAREMNFIAACSAEARAVHRSCDADGWAASHPVTLERRQRSSQEGGFVWTISSSQAASTRAIGRAPPASQPVLKGANGCSTYGELTAEGTRTLLNVLARPLRSAIFVDLGSGSGRVVLQAAMETEALASVGVELSPTRARLAERALAWLEPEWERLLHTTPADELPRGASSSSTAARRGLRDRVRLVEGNILDPLDLIQGEESAGPPVVVYVCSLCFCDHMRQRVFESVLQLPRVKVLITLNKLPGNDNLARNVRSTKTLHLPTTWTAHQPVHLHFF
mmetsp:Transcript_9252/g.30561  ORF Transcript_9252/g.30561 Transcript_9252/m.30561 type:complete len:488 (-) Transcript_9252:28-1491(-)